MQNINMKRCTSKKEIDKQVFLNLWKFHKLVFKRGYGQRKQKKERENTCVRNEKTRREKKRQQMNKCMSKKGHKEVTHACEK